MSDKDAVLEIVRQLPENATVADILARVSFRQRVDEGLRQLDNGESIEHEEVERRLSKWL